MEWVNRKNFLEKHGFDSVLERYDLQLANEIYIHLTKTVNGNGCWCAYVSVGTEGGVYNLDTSDLELAKTKAKMLMRSALVDAIAEFNRAMSLLYEDD